MHSLKTSKTEDVYSIVVQCWREITSSNKSTLESEISQILNMSMALLLQVTEDTRDQVSLPMN